MKQQLKIWIALLLLLVAVSAPASTIHVRRAHPVAGGGGGTITLVKSAVVHQTNAVTSQALAFPTGGVTAGDLIGAAGVHSRTGVTITCSDTLGNTYAKTPASDNATTTSSPFICYSISTATGANTLTVTFVGDTAATTMGVFEFNASGGWNATPFDADVFTSHTAGTTWTSNALTVAQNSSLLLMVSGNLFSNATYTAGACCTILQQASGSNQSAAIEYLLNTPSGSNVPTLGISASIAGWSLAASFKQQ